MYPLGDTAKLNIKGFAQTCQTSLLNLLSETELTPLVSQTQIKTSSTRHHISKISRIHENATQSENNVIHTLHLHVAL